MKNKYNIGEKVWFMDNNRPVEDMITGIFLLESTGTNDEFAGPVKYIFGKISGWNTSFNLKEGVEEDYVYPTKETLISAL